VSMAAGTSTITVAKHQKMTDSVRSSMSATVARCYGGRQGDTVTRRTHQNHRAFDFAQELSSNSNLGGCV
jgi:hypothetical protein